MTPDIGRDIILSKKWVIANLFSKHLSTESGYVMMHEDIIHALNHFSIFFCSITTIFNTVVWEVLIDDLNKNYIPSAAFELLSCLDFDFFPLCRLYPHTFESSIDKWQCYTVSVLLYEGFERATYSTYLLLPLMWQNYLHKVPLHQNTCISL